MGVRVSSSSCELNPVGARLMPGLGGGGSCSGGEACFLCTGGENSLCDVCTLRTGCGLKSSSGPLGAFACLTGSCLGACVPGHCVPSTNAPGLRSETDRGIMDFFLETSAGGSVASSPPSPMISGADLAKPTVNPGLLGGFLYPDCCCMGGVASLARRTSCASGHLDATAILILGRAFFSVEGLRKSTTSSFSLNELVCPGGAGASLSLNTLP